MPTMMTVFHRAGNPPIKSNFQIDPPTVSFCCGFPLLVLGFCRYSLHRISICLLCFLFLVLARPVTAQDELPAINHIVQPGDTWAALAWRFDMNESVIRSANPHINSQRQPVIGKQVAIPNSNGVERTGKLLNVNDGGLLQQAIVHHTDMWLLSLLNDHPHPYYPLLYRPLFVPVGQDPPRQYPVGFLSLELSHIPAQPGQGLAVRAQVEEELPVSVTFANIVVNTFVKDNRLIGIFGTGAFFDSGDHELSLLPENSPLWSQPWNMVPGEWTFEDITLTGEAATIDAESIRVERERLSAIWNQAQGLPLWNTPFQQPIDQYLSISSDYGARRSYNGGPYQSYHEGVDFSAYGGTPVFSPAAGTIVLAERLFVRGGAVLIDHGFGIFSGVYHMSEVLVQTGQQVDQGELVGKVGSTGLSTGNHLHWDMLVAGTWIDAAGWLDSNIACWILEGWDQTCVVE